MQHSSGSRSQVKVTSQSQLGSDAHSACGRLTFFVCSSGCRLLPSLATLPSGHPQVRLILAVEAAIVVFEGR
jgi:hypothetical protein